VGMVVSNEEFYKAIYCVSAVAVASKMKRAVFMVAPSKAIIELKENYKKGGGGCSS